MAMNYDGMNGTDNMDSSESRKRPLDTESENGVTKRSNQGAANCHDYHEEEMSTQQSQGMTDLGGDNVHLKILVPSIAAGAIIGKGGETIAQVQKEAGARVKMSKANDFYPGTTERVCLIMGAAESVRKVHTFIMEKIREKPDPNPKPEASKSNFERHRQVTVINVKILVPNSTAGMIIGKAGNYIKQIKEESGAYVQISQKSKETNLPERCITVAGDLECNKKAVDLILQKIVEDPQSGSCPNISYADYTGPVASANPTGSPFANTNFMQSTNQEITGVNNNFAGGAIGFGFSNAFNNTIGGGMANLNLNSMLGGQGGAMSSAALDNLRMTLRNSGYTDQATEEISTAMNTLASYGILGMGLGMGGQNVQQNIQQTQQMNPQMAQQMNPQMNPQMTGLGSSMGPPQGMLTGGGATPTPNPASAQGYMMNTPTSSGAGSLFGPVGSGSSGLGSSGSTAANSSLFGSSSPSMQQDRYGGSPMLNDSYTGAPGYTSTPGYTTAQVAEARSPSINVNQNSFGLGPGIYSPTEDKSLTTKQELEVPETIVGAILGPGGKGIVELQQYTQTNIQISKKGVYSPGTRNRIVTITGSSSNITKAQYLIQQRIQQEEIKRARQAQVAQAQVPQQPR